MKVKAIAPWFGGKRNMAERIVKALGPHTAYWEPFCGSLAVLLAKEPCRMETVNDLHGDLINLARVIQDEVYGEKLYRRLQRMLMHEELFQECKAALRELPDVVTTQVGDAALDRAAKYFLVSWMGRNGGAGTTAPGSYCVRYTCGGGAPATRWNSAVESMPVWHRRLREVMILRRDAFEILPRIEDADGTVMYVDPPYIVKGAKYVHDFDSADHARMAEQLRRFKKTRVVLSYYDHPWLTELYPGWEQEHISVSKASAHQGKRGTNDTRAVEVLLTNQHDDQGLYRQGDGNG